jgi:hypothetical protein
MSRDAKRYRRQEKAKQDLAQLTFGSSGEVTPRKKVMFSSEAVDLSQEVMCPFCLEKGVLQRFIVSTKTGISQKKALCPFCGVGMMMRNLLRKWDPITFADWVFGYRRGFFQKVDFPAWRKKLFDMGWAGEFWRHYNALKGEDKAAESGVDEDEAGRLYDEEFG